ncbi:MAG: STAS domain-containing protein [Methanosphaera sp.]|nr:STAS domain-containing protein [Methanosphaera sp.]
MCLKLLLIIRFLTILCINILYLLKISFISFNHLLIINSVIIDCSKLEYVSSAGIRVLLIMHNNCKDGIIMKSCNETVIRDLSNTNIKIQ